MGLFSSSNIRSSVESLKDIEEALLSLNVSSFVKEFDGETLDAVYFTISSKEKKEFPVRLPLNLDKIKEALSLDYRKIGKKEKIDIHDIAEKIALNELAKFIETACNLVRSNQTSLEELFLPFIYDKNTNRTFYESIEGKDLKLIGD